MAKDFKLKELLLKIALATYAILAPVHSIILCTGILIMVDLVTGILASKKLGKPITSAGFRRTVVKMTVYQTAIITGFIVEKFMLNGTIPISNLVAGVIGLVEMTSLLENLEVINGNPIFKTIIKKLRSENDKDIK